MEGGTPAWEAAGYVLFSGVNVPSKAFGEWVEHHYHTPSIDPAELQAMRESGEHMVILDSRPMDEFRRMSIPGAIDVPGGELVYRLGMGFDTRRVRITMLEHEEERVPTEPR